MKLSQTSLSSPSILFHAVAPSRKQGRPSVRVSQIVDGSKPTIQPRLKKHAAGRPPEESLDLPCGSSLFSPTRDAHHPGFFAKNSLSTLSGLWAAQRNQGRQSIRQSDVDFVVIPLSSNKFGLLQNDAEVDDLLAENDKVKESRGRQRSTTARESALLNPPSTKRSKPTSQAKAQIAELRIPENICQQGPSAPYLPIAYDHSPSLPSAHTGGNTIVTHDSLPTTLVPPLLPEPGSESLRRGRIDGFLHSLSWGQAFHRERCYRQHRFLPLKIQHPQLPPD
jgi:hypothetical protein